MATRQSSKIQRTCEICNAIFYVYRPAAGRQLARSCSKACRDSRRQRSCDECGRAFEAFPSARQGKYSFCSTACNYAHRTSDIATRFLRYIDPRPDPNGCLIWTGAISATGYGKIGLGGKHGGHVGAHRVAWEIANGPIPVGLSVLHRCDNRPCVNPEHLFLGTLADNMADMRTKGRNVRGEKCTNSQLNADAVREIRRLYSQLNMKGAGIARQLGVSASAVNNVISGKTWRHI